MYGKLRKIRMGNYHVLVVEDDQEIRDGIGIYLASQGYQVFKACLLYTSTTQCVRVPVLDGHTAAVFVKFGKKPSKEELIHRMVNYSGLPQKLGLPSAPKQFIQYLEEDNRPQVSLDVDFERGMGISVGRLREDTVYDLSLIHI